MIPYIVILQFGPVQDFIQTARRTDDYWAGSFLLSFATAHMINMLQEKGGEIIFPDPADNELVQAVGTGRFDNEESLFPSLPNRLGVRIQAENVQTLKSLLEKLKTSVLEKCLWFFEKIENELDCGKQISREQVFDLFECYYALAEDDPDSPCSSIQVVEKKLAARKNIRDFKSFFQNGFKCTQCGFREPIGKDVSNLIGLKNDWEKIRNRHEYQYVFKKNERLCAVCSGKRLLRRVCFGGGSIPSTSTIGVSEWLARVDQAMHPGSGKSQSIANAFSSFFLCLKQSEIEQKMVPVPANRKKSRPVYQIEGDWFIDDSYDRREKQAQDENNLSLLQKIKNVRKKLNKFLRTLPPELRTPPKYYTLLSFDGDDMGEYKKTLATCEEHKTFSRELAGFSKTVYQVVHEQFHGYVVYSGGDEGVALIPLSETFQVMEKLRKKFNQLKGGLTLSSGAVVMHHQAPLGMGLKAASETLRNAKKISGKNAFSISIRKRSGSQLICRAPWEIKTETDVLKMADFFKEWEDAYAKGMSPRWYQRMQSDMPVVRTDEDRYDQDMALNLFYYLLPRQSPAGNKGLGLSLAKKLDQMMKFNEEFDDIDNLLSILYVPIYFYEGGKN